MIPAWLTKAVVPVIILAALALGGVFLVLKVISTVDGIRSTARQEGISERDSYWTAQVEKSNALAAQAEAAQARETLRINNETAKVIADLQSNITTLRKANAALPNGNAVGLDRARVQLLPD